jgi:putative flippase GtrA
MPPYLRKESDQIMQNEKKKELIRTIKFVLFSASAGLIQIISFALLNELMSWSYWPSYLISLTLSVLWNFTLNRRFTFKSANNVPVAMAQTAGFYLVFTPASTLFGNYLAETLLWNEYLVTIINMIANFVLEYLFQRFVVFRNSIDTNDLAQKEQQR